MLYGNAIYSVGAILIAAAAQVRSYKFMIFATIVQALGDIATQVAQYKMFSSWFAPSNGFASTLGFELGVGKIGQFVGQATANIIAQNLGDFAWVYWMAVFMNLFTNVATYVFWLFNKWSEKRYGNHTDPATGEKLTEKNKKFEFKKMLELPWPFWLVSLFSLFQTSTAVIFSTNATELAQQRFNVSAVTAGWYSAMSQYMGFFLVPIVGLFIDVLGHRLSIMMVCGTGVFVASEFFFFLLYLSTRRLFLQVISGNCLLTTWNLSLEPEEASWTTSASWPMSTSFAIAKYSAPWC